MKQYEYKVINSSDTGVPLKGKIGEDFYTERFKKGLDALGKKGWKLTSIIKGTIFIFVREKKGKIPV